MPVYVLDAISLHTDLPQNAQTTEKTTKQPKKTVISKRRNKIQNYADFSEYGFCSDQMFGSNSSQVKCPECNMPEEVGEEELGIHWYGCDVCPRWWHRHCLPHDYQATADLSTMDPQGTTFRCPACPISKLCVTCFIEGQNMNDFIQCGNCFSYNHIDCLPDKHYAEVKICKQNNTKWFCFHCHVED